MDLDDIIGKLQLEILPEEWVDSFWKGDLMSSLELPTDYEFIAQEAEFHEVMDDFSNYIKNWLSEPDTGSNNLNNFSSSEDSSNSFDRSNTPKRKSWQQLMASNLNYKALVALLSTFVQRDPKDLRDVQAIKLALSATRLYLSLLSIHGSHIYKIFNSITYCQALELLKISNIIHQKKKRASKGSRKKGNRRADEEEGGNDSISNGRSGARQRKKPSRNRPPEEDMEDDQEEDTSGGDCSLNLGESEKRALLKNVSHILDDLFMCLEALHLKEEPDSMVRTIQVLVYLTRLERTTATFNKLQRGTSTYIAFKSYDILFLLCDPNHGEVTDTIRLILLNLLPSFCITDGSDLNEASKELNVIKSHSVNFLNKMLTDLKETSHTGVKSLVQQLCVRIPDKADVRVKSVSNIVDMLQTFPFRLYESIVVWVISLCHAENVKNRVTGLEIFGKLLSLPERYGESTESRSSRETPTTSSSRGSIAENGAAKTYFYSDHEYLLATVLSRCLDIGATAQAKALSILCSVISLKNGTNHELAEQLFVSPYSRMESIEVPKDLSNEKGFFDFKGYFSKSFPESPVTTDPLPSGITILDMLEKLVEDEKVFVRKNSLHCLANVCLLSTKWVTTKRLKIMVKSCKDSSVAIRKMVTLNLTELVLRYPNNSILPRYWVLGVIPLITDNEIKSQEKVLEVIENTIFKNIVRLRDMNEPLHHLPWELLKSICNENMRGLFRYACKQWTSVHGVSKVMVQILRSHIGSENNLAAWFLIVCLSEFHNIPDPKFALQYYFEHIHDANEVDEYCSQLVLEVLHLNRLQLPASDRSELCSKLKESLEALAVPLPLISRCVDICHLHYKTEMDEWSEKMIRTCENYLKRTVGPGCRPQLPDEALYTRYVFTMAEFALIRPKVMNPDSFKLLVRLIDDENGSNDQESNEKKWEGTLSETARAVTIVTLGKLSLQDQFAAKSLVPILGNLLSSNSEPCIKINSMIALTDLAIRFTSLVEPQLGDMSICLRDPNLSVRKNALSLLMQLLQEDYIKLRCPIFYYILSMLEDKSSCIRDMTSAFFVNTVLKKNGSIMSQQFLSALFFFNDFPPEKQIGKAFSSDNQVQMSPQERALFTMAGEAMKENRRKLYRYMLDHMEDDHRFKVTYRVFTEILDEVSEGKIELDNDGTAVLRDSLYVLACDEMRMVPMRPTSDDSGEVMDAITFARKSIISELVKKNYVENIVPIVIRLKHKLMELKSPLVNDLMICLREIMKDFKEQINEILAADAELAAEVALDLRNIEEAEQEEEEEEERPLSNLMKEARIHCERLSGKILERAGITLPPLPDNSPTLAQIYLELVQDHPPVANGEQRSPRIAEQRSPLTNGELRSPGNTSRAKSPRSSLVSRTSKSSVAGPSPRTSVAGPSPRTSVAGPSPRSSVAGPSPKSSSSANSSLSNSSYRTDSSGTPSSSNSSSSPSSISSSRSEQNRIPSKNKGKKVKRK